MFGISWIPDFWISRFVDSQIQGCQLVMFVRGGIFSETQCRQTTVRIRLKYCAGIRQVAIFLASHCYSVVIAMQAHIKASSGYRFWTKLIADFVSTRDLQSSTTSLLCVVLLNT